VGGGALGAADAARADGDGGLGAHDRRQLGNRHGRREHLEVESPGSIYSIPDTRWRLKTTSGADLTNEITINTFNTPIWPVMVRIQMATEDMPFLWFHTNLALMSVRLPDAELCFTVACIFRWQFHVSAIFILNIGPVDRLREVVERIKAVLVG
jgi:hypothetical protein